MLISESTLPLLTLLAPLLAVPAILMARNPNIREAFTFLAGFLLLGTLLLMLPGVLAGHTPEIVLFPVIPGAPIALRMDPAGMLFALVASVLWIITTAYAIGYMRTKQEQNQTRFYAFFAVSLFATMGAAMSANLLTLYLFYELLSFSTYPLVGHHQSDEAKSGARKYLTYLVSTSIGLALPALLVTALLSGTLDFGGAPLLAGKVGPSAGAVLLVAFLLGFAKAALMPVHGWLPAAMVAPTPVSALLHAVAVVKVGAFCAVRVVTEVFGMEFLSSLGLGAIITGLAAVTMLVSSFTALTQDGLKRRLAFSTIGQLSYIVLGIGMLNTVAAAGGILHIAMHAFGKITLFFCAGAIYVATGEKYISRMGGIGHRMPLTMLAFLIGSLAIIGVPPTGGFLSKWLLLNGSLLGDHWLLAGVLVVSSLLNAAYFLPIVYKAWFCTPAEAQHTGPMREAPTWCLVPLLGTAALSVGVFFYQETLTTLATMAARF